jgi:hypothetical protein
MLDELDSLAGEHVARAGAPKLPFVWRSSFSFVERRLHSGSLAFERAGLFFNLAALLAHYAAAIEVEPQATAHALQVAAGCIGEAREQAGLVEGSAVSLNPLTEDMRKPSLDAIESLLLGQAQVIFAERAADKSPATQLKLWGQAALYLRGASEGLPATATETKEQAQTLATLCLARAHGFAGAWCRAERKHGLAVSHLSLSMQLFGQAFSGAVGKSALMGYVEAARAPVAVDHEEARRDNDNVYFEREVAPADLAGSIECKSMVRPLPLDRIVQVIGERVQDNQERLLLASWRTAARAGPAPP